LGFVIHVLTTLCWRASPANGHLLSFHVLSDRLLYFLTVRREVNASTQMDPIDPTKEVTLIIEFTSTNENVRVQLFLGAVRGETV
jgi:hypothetical protein